MAGDVAAGRTRVLVVDGDDDIRRLLRVKLGAAGFEVREADGITTARPVVAGDAPDVVVCERLLADGDAVALLPALAAELGARTPVVIVLGEGDSDADIVDALAAGADDYVVKPFSPHELVLRIRVALLRRAAARPAPGADTAAPPVSSGAADVVAVDGGPEPPPRPADVERVGQLEGSER